MKDFLIVYSSKTGNTEKVAKKFYEVAGERCDLAAVKQVPAVDDYKVIFAGYWVDKGEPDKDMQEFLQTLDNKKVVLFLVTSKSPILKKKEVIKKRIAKAAKYIPLDRLYLSPQCGFASCEIGNKLTEEEQWAKLALVKEIAKEVWG